MGIFFGRNGDVNLFTASAEVVANSVEPIARGALPWQIEALGANDMVGEQKILTDYVASSCSQCEVTTGSYDNNGDWVKDENLRDLGIFEDLATLVYRAANSIYLTGEFWLAAVPRSAKRDDLPPWSQTLVTDFNPPYDFMVFTPADIENYGGSKVSLRTPWRQTLIVDLANIKIVHVIQPGNRAAEPDSIVKSSLPILRQIQALTALISAQATAHNKLLKIPSEMRFAHNSANQLPASDTSFLSKIIQSISRGKEKLDQAAAFAPVVLEGDAEVLREVAVTDLTAVLDKQIQPLLAMSIKRLAVSQNAPAEMLLGLADSSRYGLAEQIRQQTALTKVVKIMPLILEALKEFVGSELHFDPIRITQNTAYFDEIMKLVELGILAPKVPVLALGYSEDDMVVTSQVEEI